MPSMLLDHKRLPEARRTMEHLINQIVTTNYCRITALISAHAAQVQLITRTDTAEAALVEHICTRCQLSRTASHAS